MKTFDIAIIGGGLSGIATARALSRISPGLAARTVIIESNPSPGSQRTTNHHTTINGACLKLLNALELDVNIPHTELKRARFSFGEQSQDVYFESPWMLAEHGLLEAWLFRQIEEVIETWNGETVEHLERAGDWVILRTTHQICRAKLVIGADGANSITRKTLRRWLAIDDLGSPPPSTPGLLSYTDITSTAAPLEAQGCLQYDFTPLIKGAPGYIWHTPGVSPEGNPLIHAGFVQHHSKEGDKAYLERWVKNQGWKHKAPPDPIIHRKYHYDPQAPLSTSHLMLVGEAAGIEPLLGDGLWQCLEYGCLAAYIARDAFEHNTFDLLDYSDSLRRCTLGREMTSCKQLSHHLFGDDWSFWVSLLVNRPGLSSLIARQASGTDSVHQNRIYLALSKLLHRFTGDKHLSLTPSHLKDP